MPILKFIFYLCLSLNLFYCAPKPTFSINGVLQNIIGLSSQIGLKGPIFSGEVSLTGSQTKVNLDRRMVPLRTLVFCSFQYGGSELGYSTTCDIDDIGSSIVIQTGGYFQGSMVRYYLAEFNSGLNVIRNNTLLSDSTLSKVITLSLPVSLTEYFILSSARASGAQTNSDESTLIKNKFLNTTQLELRRKAFNIEANTIFHLIKYDNSKVQSGNSTILNGTSTTRVSVSPVNLDKSLLLFSLRPENGISVEADYMVRGKFINNTTLEFSRIGTNVELDISYFIIEFLGDERVQSGELLGINSISATSTLSNPLKDPSRSLLLFSSSNSSSNTPDEDRTVSSYLGSILDANTVKFTRKESRGTNSNISYFIIEFP